MFSRPVICGVKAHTEGQAGAASRPWMLTVPLVGRKMPEMMRNSVVLPAPFGPISPKTSPGSIAKSTSLKSPEQLAALAQVRTEQA